MVGQARSAAASGEGLDQNIKSAYRWLGTHYQQGDKIFVFGFSRGAYTVRSLCGLITKQGLLDLSAAMDPTDVWKRVDEVFDAYRKRVPFANPNRYPFHNALQPGNRRKRRRRFISSACGTPLVRSAYLSDLVLSLLDDPAKYQFLRHGAKPHGRPTHATRWRSTSIGRAFAPTLWSKFDPAKTTLVQRWFPGVHCDVGGGYVETGLSDARLEVDDGGSGGIAAVRFHDGAKKQIGARPHSAFCTIRCTGPFKTLDRRGRGRRRQFPPESRRSLHASTIDAKRQYRLCCRATYWTTTELALGADANRTINIYARRSDGTWTGLYLGAG